MKVYVNKISGIDDAIVSMFMSKRTWTKELEKDIRVTCETVLSLNGKYEKDELHQECYEEEYEKFKKWMNSLTKWGQKHITMLRFIDISVTVEGLHRAGQDDWDSHAQRFNNRIIRSSTRLADYDYEMSNFYENKIIPTDLALQYWGVNIPQTLEIDGKTYVKSVNGYIQEEYANNRDVKRGLYMLSIPSNFIFKINLTEWSHVYKERNIDSNANPEVKLLCEKIANKVEEMIPWFNRELFMNIKN